MYLNAHTYYSFRYGTLSPQRLVEEAARRGIRTLPLTDINSTSCMSEHIQHCKSHQIKPIGGIQFQTGNHLHFTGLAKNIEGFKSLNQLLSNCSLFDQPIPDRAPHLTDAFIIYRNSPKPIETFTENEFIGIRPSEVNQLHSSPLRKYLDKLVVFNPITFIDDIGHRAHKLLRCIDLNIVLSKLKATDCAHHMNHFQDETALRKVFEQYPQILFNTERILDECSIELPVSNKNNKRSFTGQVSEDCRLLRQLASAGCRKRYGLHHQQSYERLQKELNMIIELGFTTYFLITWDITRFARSKGYHYVGRGSGANSLVAYCLQITDVDPLELNLYFERFINPHRSVPPDFDIDFSWDERDDVTAYILKKYGPEFCALLGTYNTFKGKSIVRELGKVIGLPKKDIDVIIERPKADHLHHPFAQHIFQYGKLIENFPNYLSMHSGGILITEKSLYYHSSLQKMPKGFAVTHFDMRHAEEMGFHKFDILSQRGLGHIKDTVKLIQQNKGVKVDIHDVAKIKQDRRVRSQLYSGKCIGCFYIESPAMRGLLAKLKCHSYTHLIAASSIIRPGVAQSGMMKEYIRRFHNPEKVNYLHPIFEQHLSETFGIMVYQEDVMKIVHHFAGMDLYEADILRRIMTGKKKSAEAFRKLKNKFFQNCLEKGHPPPLTKEVWRQIESFSGYSFCKAHSASFAVESFQSLFLKAYYPLEFMVGVINNFGGFYDTELYVHEARMHGAQIEPPCVNLSSSRTQLYGQCIYLGFKHLRSLKFKSTIAILAARKEDGPFIDLMDFIKRVHIQDNQLQILIRIGAFRFTGLSKYELLWSKNMLIAQKIKNTQAPQLFSRPLDDFDLPALPEDPFTQAFDEIELLKFPLCSPFDLINPQDLANCQKMVLAREMKGQIHNQVKMTGYYVTSKPVTTVTHKLMSFGTWVDREGNFFDTIHFPKSFEAFPYFGKGVYEIAGVITSDFGFPSLQVKDMKKIPYFRNDGIPSEKKDFVKHAEVI